jgi:hypothetical protein
MSPVQLQEIRKEFSIENFLLILSGFYECTKSPLCLTLLATITSDSQILSTLRYSRKNSWNSREKKENHIFAKKNQKTKKTAEFLKRCPNINASPAGLWPDFRMGWIDGTTRKLESSESRNKGKTGINGKLARKKSPKDRNDDRKEVPASLHPGGHK